MHSRGTDLCTEMSCTKSQEVIQVRGMVPMQEQKQSAARAEEEADRMKAAEQERLQAVREAEVIHKYKNLISENLICHSKLMVSDK